MTKSKTNNDKKKYHTNQNELATKPPDHFFFFLSRIIFVFLVSLTFDEKTKRNIKTRDKIQYSHSQQIT